MGAPVPEGGGGGGGGGGCDQTAVLATKKIKSSKTFFIKSANLLVVFVDKNCIGIDQCNFLLQQIYKF